MAIPNDEIIAEELLDLLAHTSGGRLHVHKIYDDLAKLHPELTRQELNNPYRNSKSMWANRVQFARLHLVQRRLYTEMERVLILQGEFGSSPTLVESELKRERLIRQIQSIVLE